MKFERAPWGGWATPEAVVDDATIYPGVVLDGEVVIEAGVTIFVGAFIGKRPKVAGIVPPKEYRPRTVIRSGAVIGANAVIYKGVEIGPNVLIGDGVTIRENTTIGEGSVVGSNSTVQNDVVLGSRVRVVDLSHITAGVRVGDDVFWSVGVLSMNDNRDGEGLKPPQVGKRAFVGGGAALLPGVEIGDDAIVAAGSVVTRHVTAGTRVQGVPARPFTKPAWAPGSDPSYDGHPLLAVEE